jgi:hypothetical protein
MFLCYMDESGTPEISSNTSHYILVGLSVPIERWKACDAGIGIIRRKYGLEYSEIHTGWMLRSYIEQAKIGNFDSMDFLERRQNVQKLRALELLRLQKSGKHKAYKQARKNYKHTDAYIHLTLNQRRSLLEEVAICIAGWGFVRLFAECIDKINYPILNSARSPAAQRNPDEQALEQIVNRVESYLSIISAATKDHKFGLLIHDNNDTVAKKHTELMQKFHRRGTSWTNLTHLVETPLFVNSQLTGMVQLADLCSYALRRYLENNEEKLFDIIFKRADRKANVVVGVRHFTALGCKCKICAAHPNITIMPQFNGIKPTQTSTPT